MARVTVNTYARLREFTGGCPTTTVELAPGTTVRELLAELQIPESLARMVFVGHRAASLDQKLQDGEQVDLFSAIGGG